MYENYEDMINGEIGAGCGDGEDSDIQCISNKAISNGTRGYMDIALTIDEVKAEVDMLTKTLNNIHIVKNIDICRLVNINKIDNLIIPSLNDMISVSKREGYERSVKILEHYIKMVMNLKTIFEQIK